MHITLISWKKYIEQSEEQDTEQVAFKTDTPDLHHSNSASQLELVQIFASTLESKTGAHIN